MLAQIVSSLCSRLRVTCWFEIVPSVKSASRSEGFEEWLGRDNERNDGAVRRVSKTVSSALSITLETLLCTAY